MQILLLYIMFNIIGLLEGSTFILSMFWVLDVIIIILGSVGMM